MSNRPSKRTSGEDPTVPRASRQALLQTVSAIGRGEVDALVLPTPQGQCVFTSASGEQPYRLLIEAMSEGALTLSRDGTILYCNSAFSRIIGSRLERVIGSSLTEAVEPAGRATLAALLAQGSHANARAELSLRSPRGSVPVYVSTQPLPNADGICAVVTDLTEVVAARQTQLRLAAIVESTGASILSTTPEGRILSWNRAAESLLGYTEREAVGRSVLDMIPVEGYEEFLQLLERVRAGESTGNLELVHLRKDGARIDVVLTLSPILDSQGNVVAASAVGRDNTARKRALRRLQSVLESAPDAILVVNRSGIIVLVNTQAEILFGYSRDALIGQRLTLLMPHRFSEFFGSWLELNPQQRLPGARHDITAVRAGGCEFPAEISIGAVETEDGLLLCGSVRDVSERFAFQKALREKNAELQAALQAKDRFLASMSHELRTPLTAIIGFIGILLMKICGPLNEAQTRQLEITRSSAHHLLALISDLLDLARIDSGKTQVKLEPVCCADALEETTRELAGAASQKNLDLTISPPATPVSLVTDRRYLRQILSNLVSNAVKFTDVGSVRLSFYSEVCCSRERVVFKVTDTGIGLQPHDLARLFTEFSRANHPAGQREGTGLGLHISQRLAALLGGRITVESEFGKGSTFTLTLPACLEPA